MFKGVKSCLCLEQSIVEWKNKYVKERVLCFIYSSSSKSPQLSRIFYYPCSLKEETEAQGNIMANSQC